jgi:hypothetical protein
MPEFANMLIAVAVGCIVLIIVIVLAKWVTG